MQPLSPTNAIAPAWNRTVAILAQPFRLGRTTRLSLCAYLALWGSFFFPFPLFYLALPRPARVGPAFFAFLGGATILGLLVLCACFYVGSRMQFVLLDLVLDPASLIKPLWRRHRPHLWGWIGLKTAITGPVALLVFLPIIPLLRRLFTLLPPASTPQQPPDPRLFFALFGLYGVCIAAFCLLLLLGSTLSDFVLPPIALGDQAPLQALRHLASFARQEPVTLLGYLGIRVLLALAGALLQYVATMVVTLGLALILGGVGLLGWFLLRTSAPQTVLLIGGGALYLIALAGMFLFQIWTFGALILFLRAFSLYFLGGRYPLLGDRLQPIFTQGAPPPPLAFEN